jgi:O-6-methylguanine DNA methyltransferase
MAEGSIIRDVLRGVIRNCCIAANAILRTSTVPCCDFPAVEHNLVAIIIPCHRVVGGNGSLTGYARGLQKKIRLLTLEGEYGSVLCTAERHRPLNVDAYPPGTWSSAQLLSIGA